MPCRRPEAARYPPPRRRHGLLQDRVLSSFPLAPITGREQGEGDASLTQTGGNVRNVCHASQKCYSAFFNSKWHVFSKLLVLAILSQLSSPPGVRHCVSICGLRLSRKALRYHSAIHREA